MPRTCAVPKAVPACGESGMSQAMTKGEWLKAAKCREIFPLSLTSFDSSPASGGAFWCSVSSNHKPALKGEVDASVTSRRRGCIVAALVYVNPSVKPSVCQLPVKGSLLGWYYVPRYTS